MVHDLKQITHIFLRCNHFLGLAFDFSQNFPSVLVKVFDTYFLHNVDTNVASFAFYRHSMIARYVIIL